MFFYILIAVFDVINDDYADNDNNDILQPFKFLSVKKMA